LDRVRAKFDGGTLVIIVARRKQHPPAPPPRRDPLSSPTMPWGDLVDDGHGGKYADEDDDDDDTHHPSLRMGLLRPNFYMPVYL